MALACHSPCSIMGKGDDDVNLSPSKEVNDLEEEVWTTPDGKNVFDQLSLLNQTFDTQQLVLGSTANGERTLKYISYAEDKMTPLDMAYEDKDQNRISTESDEGRGYYDGTGTLVWLAAKALVWMLDQDVCDIRTKYALHTSGGDLKSEEDQSPKQPLLYELGCGTGLPGIAAVLLSKNINMHVCFTDSDEEALENCRQNCRLNNLLSGSYSHEVLRWWNVPRGMPPAETEAKHVEVEEAYMHHLGTVDTVFAADVLYDVKYIPHLLQTAHDLLVSETGMMILSHVPRFCLPQKEGATNEGEDDLQRPQSKPFDMLEDHIVNEAKALGLHLVEKIRPHAVLSGTRTKATNEEKGEKVSERDEKSYLTIETLEKLKEMHAVVMIFRKGLPLSQSSIHEDA